MANLFDPSELYNLLASQGVLPQWAKRSPGRSSAEYYIDTNRIVAPPLINDERNSRRVDSLAHEMTHAVQYRLLFNAASKIQEKKLDKQKITKEEEQFLDTAQKMFGRQFGPLGSHDRIKDKQNKTALDKAIASLYTFQKGGKDEYDVYRTSPEELQAWGVGRMSKGADINKRTPEANPHLDPTQATQFSILMSQFANLPKDVQTIPSKYVEENRKKDKMNQYYQFEDMLSDPFKPTIK